ncbi:hypothetical protein [Cupriavidus campinensis]
MATTVDLTPIFSGIDVSSTVGVIVALGAIYITAEFAAWAMYEVANFFEEVEAIWSHYRYGNGDD